MIAPNVREELLAQVDRLSPDLQRRVLEYAHGLAESVPKGVPGKMLLRFSGILASEDARMMRDAIEADCERVDRNEW